MFERMQKPFLTVETGEAYQPIRLTYDLLQKDKFIARMNDLKCCQPIPGRENAWHWVWSDECEDLDFQSLDSYKKDPAKPVRLATLVLRDEGLFINLSSFKRACIAVPFFHKQINAAYARIFRADFINKVFGLDESLPHGFTELFNEEELEKIVMSRINQYREVQEKVEHAPSADEAFSILSDYTNTESRKQLPFAERYAFQNVVIADDPDTMFLGFYIYLRGRELVAIRRWFGQTDYTLADAAEETMESVFGGMDIDIIE